MKRFLANLYWLIAIFLHTQKVIPMNLTTDQLTALQTKTSALIDAAQAQATTNANLAAASAALNAARPPTRPRSTHRRRRPGPASLRGRPRAADERVLKHSTTTPQES